MSQTVLIRRVRQRAVSMWLRAMQAARVAKYRWLSSLLIKGKPTLYQPLHAVGKGILEFDGNVRVGFFPSPYFLSSCAYIEARHPGSIISIGNGTFINNGFTAIAEYSSIIIGKRVLVGTNVEILDSNFHGLEVGERSRSNPEWAKPVEIEDDVFLGSNVRVMKGVTIGRGAVVANGAVVVKDVPAYAVAGGNPARIIRYLEPHN